MALNYPGCPMRSIANLQRKLDFVKIEMQGGGRELLLFPQLLNRSLLNEIGPRFCFVRCGRRAGQVGLHQGAGRPVLRACTVATSLIGLIINRQSLWHRVGRARRDQGKAACFKQELHPGFWGEGPGSSSEPLPGPSSCPVDPAKLLGVDLDAFQRAMGVEVR